MKIGVIGLLASLIAASAIAQTPDPSSDAAKARAQQAAAERAAYNAMPDTTGTGPFPAIVGIDSSLPNHVIYRPADLSALGKTKLGLLVWGNGGCSNDAASARLHLAEIASHGYLVIATGRIMSGPHAVGSEAPAQMTTTSADMRTALDWALAENARKGSMFYQRLDPKAVAVSGHSCGGMLSLQLGADPRINAVIIHNSGVFPDRPERPTLLAKDVRLEGLHTPVLYVMGGKTDIAWPMGTGDFDNINHVPVMLVSMDVGHGGTFQKHNGGEAARVAVDWLQWQLRHDKRAAKTFTGANCGLCKDPAWTVQKKGMK